MMHKVSKKSDNTVFKDNKLTITIQVINIIFKFFDNNITKKMRLSCKEIKKEMDKKCFAIFNTSFQELYNIGKLDENTFNTLSNITQLHFGTTDKDCNYIYTIDKANKLAKLIALCPLINVIHLDDVMGNNDHICKIITNKLSNCINLQMLTLSSNYISSDGLEEICNNIIECKKIHTLNISNNDFGYNSCGFVKLANTLTFLECLSSLDISMNILGDIGFAAVAAALPNCLKLSYLNLCCICLSVIGIGILSSVLPMCSELKTLDISENELGDIGITKIADVLPMCLKLNTLDISKNELGDIGITKIAAVIPMCQVLSSIKINTNNITSIGLNIFAKAIINSNLRLRLSTLDISRTNIGEAGISILKDLLPKCLVLSNLNLSNTCKDISFSGLKNLAKTFILCEQLSCLNITSNNFSDEGLQIIVNVFPYCELLRQVDITIKNDESKQIIKNVLLLCKSLKISCKK